MVCKMNRSASTLHSRPNHPELTDKTGYRIRVGQPQRGGEGRDDDAERADAGASRELAE
jgi:hypothetical protein